MQLMGRIGMDKGGNNLFVIAHRGGAELFFENTLTAFRKAEELGVDAIECDVHLTRDNHLVVMHDPDLKRVAGIERNVSEMTLQEIREVKLENGEGIPTLEEAIEAVGISLIVELKSYETLMEIARLLHERPELKARIIVICFDHRAILKLNERFPGLNTSALLGGFPVDPASVATSCRTDTLALYYEGLDRNYVESCHSAGVKVSVWTPNTEAEIRRLVDIGVDAIASDRPDIVLKVLGRK